MKRKHRKVKGFKTHKWICCGCKQHYITLPIMQGLDMGDGCEKCGCTSFINKPGRIIGRRSKKFNFWFDLYNNVKITVPKEFCGAIFF